MKKRIALLALTLTFTFIVPLTTNSQEETIESSCKDYFRAPFIASAQTFKALLTGQETAEFHASFFAGNTYRVVACTSGQNNIIFSVLDKNRNLIFSNKNHELSSYWDFNVMGSLDCIIEAQLDPQKSTSGLALIMVGFKTNVK